MLRSSLRLLPLLGVVVNSSFAATATTTFPVTVTVNAACSVSATALSFTYAPTSGNNADATNTVTVTCTNSTTYNVGLDAGTGTGATVATRIATSGSDTVNYTLYSDAARTTIWGNTIGTNTVAGTGLGTAQNLTVFGRVFAGQTGVIPATYTDTITVTVTF